MKPKTVDAARGKWTGILSHFGLADFLINRHSPCPMCEGRDRWRYDDKDGSGSWICNQCGAGNGLSLLMKAKGWDFREAAQQVDSILGQVEPAQPKSRRDPNPRIRAMTAALKEPSANVRAYLASRGLKPSKMIYSAEADYYHEGKKIGCYDAMVCPLSSPEGEVLTYHLTYLDGGRKASVPSARKILPPSKTITGGAIRLTAIYPHIGIAEGVETALAVMQIFRIPCWSSVSAGMMEKFIPPEGIERLTIFSDNDLNFTGQKAAQVLANRLALKGMAVEVKTPGTPGTDFADKIRQVA